MIVTILGVPGAGKTTLQAWLAKRGMRKKLKYRIYQFLAKKTTGVLQKFLNQKANRLKPLGVWSNVYLEGAFMLDHDTDLNINLIENGIVLVDEGGTVMDNRSYKSMLKRVIRWYKMHRHYNIDVYITSQDYDIDKKVRALTKEIWVVSKSIIPYFVAIRKIKTKIGIAETETEIVQIFKWKSIFFGGLKLVFMPLVWHMFDTHYKDKLNSKTWVKWCKENQDAFTYDFTKPDTVKLFEKGGMA